MKYKINKDDEPTEVKTVMIYIGLDRYRLTQSNNDKLQINKMSDGIEENIIVFPRMANVIEII